MRVLLVNQFFFPDVAAVAQLMTDLAEDLASRGVRVGVLCGRTQYSREGGAAAGSRSLPPSIRVYRVPALNLPGRSGMVHALNYAAFHLVALLRALFLPRYDVSIVFTNPPLIPVVGWVLKRLRGTKFIQVVEDVYPDVAVRLGFLGRSGPAARLTAWLSAFLLRSSDRAIALGEAMKRVLVAKGISPERVVEIPNWADGKEIFPVAREQNPFLDSHGLRGRFVVQYSGHMGEAHDFLTILETAESLRDHGEIVFLFVGGGPRKEEIALYKTEHALSNVEILPYQERAGLRFSLSAADVALISLNPDLEELMFPCKVYGIMAAGRPFLYVGSEKGEIGQIAGEAGCGFAVRTGDVEGLRDLVLRLWKDAAQRAELGSRARRYFLEHFDRPLATARYYDALVDVLEHETG
jgi:colanic acid biosynthesis glycosyl transferase WcaI